MSHYFADTMLVLGAGAHVPYGLPTSKQLTNTIRDLVIKCSRVILLDPPTYSTKSELDKDKINICRLMDETKIAVRLPTHGSNSFDIMVGDMLDDFIRRFAKSKVYSIDRYMAKGFLSNQDSNIKLGKLIIAYLIGKYEDKTEWGFHDFDWIEYLINEFLVDPESMKRFFEHPPKIVTFNYDNYFELALMGHLTEYHKKSHEEALLMVSSLNIRHVYGDINSYQESNKGVSFFENAISRIVVAGEERTDVKIGDFMYETVPSLSKVYFLGFGFDPLNVNCLFSKLARLGRLDNVTFYASNFGLTQTEMKEIQRGFPFKLKFPSRSSDGYALIREDFPIFR